MGCITHTGPNHPERQDCFYVISVEQPSTTTPAKSGAQTADSPEIAQTRKSTESDSRIPDLSDYLWGRSKSK